MRSGIKFRPFFYISMTNYSIKNFMYITPPQTTSHLLYPMYPDDYSTSSKIPKQFTDVLYSEVKKLLVLDFISKYLLLVLSCPFLV